MPLPILDSRRSPQPGDLLRFYHRTELHWSRHLSEEAEMPAGTALFCPQFPNVYMANRMHDAALPDGVLPRQAIDEINAHYAAHNVRCWRWVMNPSADAARVEPLVQQLLADGYVRQADHVMYLRHFPRQPLAVRNDLTIIPARASFRHVRQIAEESAADWHTPELADAALLHLDDPHVDAVLAMKDGAVAAYAAVLAVGEIGCLESLYVSAPFRNQRVGSTMMSRVLEICQRSLFKHVFLTVLPDNAVAQHLYERCGFEKIGEFVTYTQAATA